MNKIKLFLLAIFLFVMSQSGTLLSAYITIELSPNILNTSLLALFFIFLISCFLFISTKLNLKSKLTKSDIKYVFMTPIAIFVINVITKALFNITDNSQNQEAILSDISKGFIPVSLVLLTAPLFEEIIFRGIIYQKIFNKNIIGLLIQAFLFSLPHILPDILGGTFHLAFFLQYFIPAIIYALVYKKTNKLEIPILAHFVNNVFPVLILVIIIIFEIPL
ncbi:CPBP family intramembrane glutamic endopeptidase [Vagococcus silagei]|nr:type II CAAX endopeptidase family protein [Vagococcus silagei]